jgi:tyrosyl-tRNA synthetase
LLCRTVAESKSAARRLVQQGGAYVNNVRISDADRRVTAADLVTPTLLVVRGGRKDYRLVRAK